MSAEYVSVLQRLGQLQALGQAHFDELQSGLEAIRTHEMHTQTRDGLSVHTRWGQGQQVILNHTSIDGTSYELSQQLTLHINGTTPRPHSFYHLEISLICLHAPPLQPAVARI